MRRGNLVFRLSAGHRRPRRQGPDATHEGIDPGERAKPMPAAPRVFLLKDRQRGPFRAPKARPEPQDYSQSIYRQAASAAVAPSATAVVSWRTPLLRQSPATNTPGVWVRQRSSESK